MRFPLDYAPGVVIDDTALASGGRYIDADKIRWVQSDSGQTFRPQLTGGWERLVRTTLSGVCRTAFAWNDNAGRLCIAFGTHTKLYVWRGGTVYDITPYGPPTRAGTDPFTVTSASAVVTVHQVAHGYTTGMAIKVFGSAAVGGITPNGGPFTITRTDADHYTFSFTSSATSGITGGGAEVVIVPQVELPAGQVNGTGTAGYGTGSYGVGGYGQPSAADYFPRTWSFGTLGEALIASPRDGAVFEWDNDTSVRAEYISGAPVRCASILTTPERIIMALGTEEEVSHQYNARCLRHSDPTDETIWNTDENTLAREKVLEGAGRIVAGRTTGPANLIWTDNEVFQAQYVGSIDEVYSFTKLGEDCGLLGPNAVVTRNQRGYWMTPDLQFCSVANGGEPAVIPCPMRDELRNNLSPSQRDKIVASTISAFSEVWFHYPDRRDGLENSRAVFFSVTDGWWSKARLARTAFCDAGPADYPVGVDVAGACYWHERGNSADGGAISWSLSAAPQYIDSGQTLVFLRSFWPDFQGQQGNIDLTLTTFEYPQSTPITLGPYSMAPGLEKVDLHCTGRLIGWTLSGNSGPAQFRLGTPIVEGRAGGRGR